MRNSVSSLDSIQFELKQVKPDGTVRATIEFKTDSESILQRVVHGANADASLEFSLTKLGKTQIVHPERVIVRGVDGMAQRDIASLKHPVSMLFPNCSQDPMDALTLSHLKSGELFKRFRCVAIQNRRVGGASHIGFQLAPVSKRWGAEGWETCTLWFETEGHPLPVALDAFELIEGPNGELLPETWTRHLLAIGVREWSDVEADVYRSVSIPTILDVVTHYPGAPDRPSRPFTAQVSSLVINEVIPPGAFRIADSLPGYEVREETPFIIPQVTASGGQMEPVPAGAAARVKNATQPRQTQLFSPRLLLLGIGTLLIVIGFFLKYRRP